MIPNKVFQGLACGRPVITSRSPAYPTELLDSPTGGVTWTAPGDAQELAERLAFLASDYRRLALRAQDARSLYDRFFAEDVICGALREALACLGPWA